MNTSPNGIALIKRYEGFEAKAYKCPAGVWTIGYGHTSRAGAPEVRPGMVITEAEAERILINDLNNVFEPAVLKSFPNVKLTQGQFDALVSFTYNLGPKWLIDGTFAKELRKGNAAAVPRLLMRFVRGSGKVLPGLISRRKAEGLLFEGKPWR